eukprot:1162060-Pelagomonas_calceolata.AAC.6
MHTGILAMQAQLLGWQRWGTPPCASFCCPKFSPTWSGCSRCSSPRKLMDHSWRRKKLSEPPGFRTAFIKAKSVLCHSRGQQFSI